MNITLKTTTDKVIAAVIYVLSSMIATGSALMVVYLHNFGGYDLVAAKVNESDMVGSIPAKVALILRYPAIGLLVVSLVFTMFVLATIMANADYDPDKLKIIDRIPFDVFSMIMAFLIAFDLSMILLASSAQSSGGNNGDLTLINLIAYITITIAFLLLLVYFDSVAVRTKGGSLFQNTVICKLFRKKKDDNEDPDNGKEKQGSTLFMTKFFIIALVFVMIDIVVVALNFINSYSSGDVKTSRNVVLLSALLILVAFIIGLLFLFFTINFNRLRENGAMIVSSLDSNVDSNVDSRILFGDFKEINNEFIQMNEERIKALEEKNRNVTLRNELITNVSHDIKSPLTSIINYSDIICSGKCTEEELKNYNEIIKKQSGRLTNLLQNLIDISLISSRTIANNPEKLNLNIFMAQVLDECEEKFSRRNLYVVKNIIEDDVYIMADGANLWRIFDNIVSNISKYAMENTNVILIVKRAPDQKIVISIENVTDKVQSFSAEDLEERFVRGDVSRTTEGNGLGISIIKELTKLQGGEFRMKVDEDTFKTILTFDEVLD
ncbi:MAG: GHKL domain-containing protein [Clostridia bacterium]|nr:GHKL domain-containing protein [Clostridia bacterium]